MPLVAAVALEFATQSRVDANNARQQLVHFSEPSELEKVVNVRGHHAAAKV